MSVKINKDIIECVEITLRYIHKWKMFSGDNMSKSNHINIVNHMVCDLYNESSISNLEDSYYVRMLRTMKKAVDVLCAGYSKRKTICFMEFMYSFWIRNVRDVVLDEVVINNLISEFEENYTKGD